MHRKYRRYAGPAARRVSSLVSARVTSISSSAVPVTGWYSNGLPPAITSIGDCTMTTAFSWPVLAGGRRHAQGRASEGGRCDSVPAQGGERSVVHPRSPRARPRSGTAVCTAVQTAVPLWARGLHAGSDRFAELTVTVIHRQTDRQSG